MSTTPRKPRPLRPPKAGEAVPEYGLVNTSDGFRRTLRARERATVEKALQILGGLLTAREVFDSPTAVKDYLRLQLGAEPREHFAVLFLNSQHRAIAFERMAVGTLTQASVYPREVALAALRHGAAAVVLAHNHPSGSTAPSRVDEALTLTLKQALALVDVRVLDHVIVSATGALSMAEKGLM
ncbi:JAB domain-containing protein [Comamonas granuli]|uniref:JAB domain-containing protein n=1 Tax=Comamonas granuli TaxID=290309 RepID=UPI000693BCD8|nr:JAB domain-containing protein [Comamonas granuli]